MIARLLAFLFHDAMRDEFENFHRFEPKDPTSDATRADPTLD